MWTGDVLPSDLAGAVGAAFGHAGAAPFAVTLLFLWLFGDNVEDQTGRWRFVLLYLLCGLCAAAWMAAIAPWPARDAIGAVGAAGAVSGILGAYFVRYPRSRVLVLVPVPLALHELPAALFLGVWFVVAVLTLAAHNRAGAPGADIVLGLSAHGVAFAAGALLCLLLRRRERAAVEWWDGNGR